MLKHFPVQSTSLGGEDFDGAWPVVDELIAKAGVRRGKWIDGLAETAGGELVVQGGDGDGDGEL